ncbi:hypothetical protein FACS1894180_2340 [Bacteroidia bacterium]|nr:hypothetical protein FACS1894180_2340 [Bacteroidia bacterium]
MKTLFYILSIILVGFIFTTCLRVETTVYVDEESKQYCLFGKGTYWIYQDSTTLEADSVFIYYCLHGPLQITNFGFEGEEYYIEGTLIHNNDFDNPQHYNMHLTSLKVDYANIYDSIPKPIWMDNSRRDDYYFRYHNGNLNDSFFGVEFIDTIDIMPILDSTYYSVKQFQGTNSDITDSCSIWYFARNVGLIRIETQKDGERVVKNLIKYDVKPYKNN